MSFPKYPIKELIIDGAVIQIPHIKRRVIYPEGKVHTLTQEDIYTDRGQILANLAFKFYGDPSYWTVLQDNNAPISDFCLDVGFRVFIPKIT
jgi:hypothetical protein